MENAQPRYATLNPMQTPPPTSSSSDLFSGKNFTIVVLLVLLALSFVGVNLLDYISNIIKAFIAIFTPIITPILALFGYTTGKVINTTADVASDTAKAGIDVAEGAVQSVGNLLISASKGGIDTTELDAALQLSKPKVAGDPDADTTANPIQNQISAQKTSWCLVGEVAKRRGCIMVDDDNKCMSKQLFSSKQMCLNPTQTPNIQHSKTK
jgi:hypothetical protein